MSHVINHITNQLKQLKSDITANIKIDHFNNNNETTTITFKHDLWPHNEINCLVNERFISQLGQLIKSFNHTPHTYFAKNIGELTNSVERRDALAALTTFCMKPNVVLDKQSNDVAILALRVAILAGEYQAVIDAVNADNAMGLYKIIIGDRTFTSDPFNILNTNFNTFVRRIYGEPTKCPNMSSLYNHVLELPITSAQDCHNEKLRNWLISHNYQLAYNYDI